MIALFCVGLAWSGGPTHLRVAARPPANVADLSAMQIPVRLWWDKTGSPMQVQVAKQGAWMDLSEAAQPGFETPPLPRGTALRVGGQASGFSEPVYVPWYFGPTDLSTLVADPKEPLAGTVGEIVVADDTVWAATLGGGLVRIEGDDVRRWTQFDGLPSDTVIAVAAQQSTVVVGTAAGAARLVDGVVDRMWDTELPDPWTQAVAISGEQMWAGTLRGLVRLSPWSVLSDSPPSVYTLSPADDGMWTGMGGLRWVDADGVVSPVQALEGDRVYDVVVGEQVWIASEGGGVQILDEDGQVSPSDVSLGSAFSMAKGPGGWWVAGGSQGLLGPFGQVVGYPDGLPGHSVWSVAADPDGASLWVGTDRGLAQFTPAPAGMLPIVRSYPVGRWPARSAAVDVYPVKNGFWLADDRGVHRFGELHRNDQNLVVAAPEQMIALVPDAKSLWAVGRWAVIRMDHKGRLSRAHSRVAIRDAALFRGTLWFITERGLHKLDRRTMETSLVLEREGFTRLVSSKRAMWTVMDGIPVQIIGSTSRPFMRASAVEDLSASGDFVCLGTRDGLEVMFPDGEVIDVLGDADARAVVSAVASDGAGACWFATASGAVGRTGSADQVRIRQLPVESDVAVYRIVPDGDWLWVITNHGIWRVHIARA